MCAVQRIKSCNKNLNAKKKKTKRRPSCVHQDLNFMAQDKTVITLLLRRDLWAGMISKFSGFTSPSALLFVPYQVI